MREERWEGRDMMDKTMDKPHQQKCNRGDKQNTGHVAPSTREQIHRFIEDATYKRPQTGRMNKGGWKELYKIRISADFTMVGL